MMGLGFTNQIVCETSNMNSPTVMNEEDSHPASHININENGSPQYYNRAHCRTLHQRGRPLSTNNIGGGGFYQLILNSRKEKVNNGFVPNRKRPSNNLNADINQISTKIVYGSKPNLKMVKMKKCMSKAVSLNKRLLSPKIVNIR